MHSELRCAVLYSVILHRYPTCCASCASLQSTHFRNFVSARFSFTRAYLQTPHRCYITSEPIASCSHPTWHGLAVYNDIYLQDQHHQHGADILDSAVNNLT